jgi:Subtilase family
MGRYLNGQSKPLYPGGAVASNSTRTPEDTMPEPAPSRAILASHSADRPGEVDRLNAILEDAGLGRPLGPPARSTSAVVVLPVSADPHAVAAVLRQAAPEGGGLYEASSGYSVHTVNEDTTNTEQPLMPTVPLLRADGLKTGHGTVAWVPVGPDKMKPAPHWPPHGSPPVVVVLDSGVKPHNWLPADTETPRFCVDAQPDPSYGLPLFDDALHTGEFGGYWGHATFLAGLIRLAAPDAQVVSVRLMSDNGTLNDYDVLSALDWLTQYMDDGNVADVVLMAFGRPKEPGEDNPASLTQKLADLGQRGVKFVASAGNRQVTPAGDLAPNTEVIPACLAADPDSPVVSVGAGTSADDREPYSMYGPWVHEWRPGTVVSLMPLTTPDSDGNGYALWSGTSFSAAIRAGELAQACAAQRAAGAGT